MDKVRTFLRKNWVFIVYFFTSGFLFIKLVQNAPPVVHDASLYNDLANGLSKNNYNIFTFDFRFRTFGYPLFLAVLKLISTFIKVNDIALIYMVQFLLFHVTNFLLYIVVKKHIPKVASLFLLLSGINMITLSFTNILLTENLIIFFTALLFYLLFYKKNLLTFFFIGIVSSLMIFVRPSSISLVFIILIFLTVDKISRKVLLILSFLTGLSLILVIGIINTNNVWHSFGFFSPTTSGIYTFQLKIGSYFFKYETAIDKSLSTGGPMVYFSDKTKKKYEDIRQSCNSEIQCVTAFLKRDAVSYILINTVHLFNVFDRIYIDTYVKNIHKHDLLLQIFNYTVISSSIIYFLFFAWAKYKRFLLITFLFIFATVVIYIPTAVEPRYSAPIFPLLLIFASLYFYQLIEKRKPQFLLLNLIFIVIFLAYSNFISSQLYVSPIPLFYW